MEFNFIDLFLHLDQVLEQWAMLYGTQIYLMLFLIIFCETGLVVMPFLPGDSLLFVAGLVAALGKMDPLVLAATLIAAAILGDSTNYLIGRTLGERLFRNPNSKIFRRDYLVRTEAFYARHGGKTVTLARFVPIVRTFAPFVAGMGRMPYLRFLGFSVFGTLVWVGSLVSLGYYFGNVEIIRKNLTLMVLGIIGISLLPMCIHFVQHKLQQRKGGA
ncbi:DedA family protein [Chitinilyticum piscinae]|uniref:DedA family protein n=1 Tax=Chitinilyticum piscinae TaxID=2866724 RepID=A0A8J7G192_9NEIS|nr:DedA family protein [Chitinilyticum piscinae]MBE9610130.1 DedA family protein [Chitinilyticum piscinae]